MMGHLNGCMLLGFRNENKNETLELFHPEPRRRKKEEIKNNCYSGPVSNMICWREDNFLPEASEPHSIIV